ncbi:aminotransferase class I/II-fold pyridoxal phosphate-dependent enzyme [Aminipila butyrica]|uniref:Aminotransferase class I/II-fold pyridoxal phosphate-dependent enzyme n=1 Tax=Aminipila butyrica TaxID=433296 RepID=A0A858C134_9FIRM|nr:aminotransferase class I/II-fold pyridoxal phosphate-dependent enzyme [Aminipila butyrica]QIB70146.1 aminotransferase class I/II-fold pyridoxal phosphate-dependent enzyme [Aminipila butyrica]
MIFLRCDYSEGAHPQILDALTATNMEQSVGYGEDPHCLHAAALIKERIARADADIHFFVGGTQTNYTSITAFLRPHEAVIAAARAHICVHETGAVEARGHKIITTPTTDAKLNPDDIDEVIRIHEDEHFVKPKMVFISDTTELGTIYNKAELQEIRKRCDKYGLYLYLDGARLASALTSPENDLTLQDIAQLTDAFYIGGTKNGALFGEALILLNPELKKEFRWIMKQTGSMLAKGRLLGVQFETLFQDNLYFELGQHANRMATMLREGIAAKGYRFITNSPSNQIFPIFPNELVAELEKSISFEKEGPVGTQEYCIRFVTSWATPEEDIQKVIDLL